MEIEKDQNLVVDERSYMFQKELAEAFPQPSMRRASFPFCTPDFQLMPAVQPLGDRWKGIYGSVLYPPKPLGGVEEGFVEQGNMLVSQNPHMAVSSTSMESFSDFLLRRKFFFSV